MYPLELELQCGCCEPNPDPLQMNTWFYSWTISLAPPFYYSDGVPQIVPGLKLRASALQVPRTKGAYLKAQLELLGGKCLPDVCSIFMVGLLSVPFYPLILASVLIFFFQLPDLAILNFICRNLQRYYKESHLLFLRFYWLNILCNCCVGLGWEVNRLCFFRALWSEWVSLYPLKSSGIFY